MTRLTTHDRRQLAQARNLAHEISRQAQLALDDDEPLRWGFIANDANRLARISALGYRRHEPPRPRPDGQPEEFCGG